MTERPRAFEDFTPGEVIELGSKRVDRDEILAFAERYDPQPMHLDDAAADASMLGGLAASGWHTVGMFMRLLCDNLLLGSTGLGSPGIDRLRWLKPVRPGDVLTGRAEVVETRVSRSRPDVGIVQFRFVLADRAGEPVMTMDNPILFARREVTP